MQREMHDRPIVRVADRMDLSGRATAEVNLDRFHNRICKVCVLVAAALILFAAAYAETASLPTNQPPGEPIVELQAEVAALQTQVNAQQAQITSLQNQLVAAQPVPALAPFVSVDPKPENGVIGPNTSFKGAKIHILSGSGATNDNGSLFGLGNSIIGYAEIPSGGITAGTRGGSHSLVIGQAHSFTSGSFGGLVAGEQNTISAETASVSGGFQNIASNAQASVSGGDFNAASGTPKCAARRLFIKSVTLAFNSE